MWGFSNAPVNAPDMTGDTIAMRSVCSGVLVLQAMRFGNDLEGCLKAIQIGFELSPRPNDTVYQGATKTLEMVCLVVLAM